ncbi:MAG: endonuclease domain-containing protein [Alphaproteobacteria bacterium]|nr:MAG: endonuclease domain-containing protein [Alphaproteobacteria bacterium]
MIKYAKTHVKPWMRKLGNNLRQDMTLAEILLWQELKSSQLEGLKFRRQQPLGSYIADFYCPDKKLIIEIDGASHEFSIIYEKDLEKEKFLNELGCTVIRFTNEDVKKNIEGVLIDIKKAAGILTE